MSWPRRGIFSGLVSSQSPAHGVQMLSRPDLIDSALLRPGRLDKAILCDMPNKEERREVCPQYLFI